MKIPRSQLKKIIMEELNEVLTNNHEVFVKEQMLPLLLQMAEGDRTIAVEMAEDLKKQLEATPAAIGIPQA